MIYHTHVQDLLVRGEGEYLRIKFALNEVHLQEQEVEAGDLEWQFSYKVSESNYSLATRTISSPPPAIEISTPREIIVTFPHPPLFSHNGYCLGVDVKPPSLLF